MATAFWDVFFKVTQEMHLCAKNRIQMSAENNQQKHFCKHAPISIALVGVQYPSLTVSVQSLPSPPWPHDFTMALARDLHFQNLSKSVPRVSSDTGGAEQHHTWLNLASSGSRAGIHHRALMQQSMFSVCRVCSLSLYQCQTSNHTNLKINRVNGY